MGPLLQRQLCLYSLLHSKQAKPRATLHISDTCMSHQKSEAWLKPCGFTHRVFFLPKEKEKKKKKSHPLPFSSYQLLTQIRIVSFLHKNHVHSTLVLSPYSILHLVIQDSPPPSALNTSPLESKIISENAFCFIPQLCSSALFPPTIKTSHNGRSAHYTALHITFRSINVVGYLFFFINRNLNRCTVLQAKAVS